MSPKAKLGWFATLLLWLEDSGPPVSFSNHLDSQLEDL